MNAVCIYITLAYYVIDTTALLCHYNVIIGLVQILLSNSIVIKKITNLEGGRERNPLWRAPWWEKCGGHGVCESTCLFCMYMILLCTDWVGTKKLYMYIHENSKTCDIGVKYYVRSHDRGAPRQWPTVFDIDLWIGVVQSCTVSCLFRA